MTSVVCLRQRIAFPIEGWVSCEVGHTDEKNPFPMDRLDNHDGKLEGFHWWRKICNVKTWHPREAQLDSQIRKTIFCWGTRASLAIPHECAITWLPNGNGAGWYPASGRKLHFYSGGSSVDMIENGTAEFLSSRGILACFAGLVFKSASWDQRGLHNRALWQEDLGSLEMRLLRILRGSQEHRVANYNLVLV